MFGEDEMEGACHGFGDFYGFREFRGEAGAGEVVGHVCFDGGVGGGLVKVCIAFSLLSWSEGGKHRFSACGGGGFGW